VIRLIIMVFVVSVHTLSFAGGGVTLASGAVATVFHTSRELFLLLTALVLTYNYGKRPLRAGRFWRRRFWLVLPAYVTWSAVYYAANGASRGAFPGAFCKDLLNAGARYHLYFLLVSMQIYLLFPLIRWALKRTERYHAWIFCLALAYQAWITVALHYKVGRQGNGLLAQFINGAGTGNWITAYVLYVVAGALAGWHFESLCGFTRRVLRSGWRVALVTLAGLAAGLGAFFIEVELFGATPGNASAVFQPVVIAEALLYGWALLGFGLLWTDRGAPGRAFAAAGSASSFGIYLAHPLVLQALLRVAGSHYFGKHGGLLAWLHRSSLDVPLLLFVAVPLIYACAWVIASASRRTPLSLFLTGREWKPSRKFRLGQATDRVLDAVESVVISCAARIPRLVVAVVLAVAAVAAVCTATVNHVEAVASRTINTTVSTIKVGDMTRSYTVLTPAKTTLPASAPIIVMLSGIFSTQQQEINRDQFTSYAEAGDAEVVYPLAYRESWNALGCCSWASLAGVDDVDFIKSLIPVLDPGRTRPIYLVGYSNGGRLAYRLACTDPLLFTGTIVVKADPIPGCTVQTPMNIMQVAATDDTDVPYKPGEKGSESPPATVQLANLLKSSGCTSKSSAQTLGSVTYTLWTDCTAGTRVGFAAYSSGGHVYPRPPNIYPAASQVAWSFITGKPVAPQPKAPKP
jgi:poly(3-hydroxybutyrate) depolymerase/surface polysaccharide O-acyltransferase-like enzyme